MYTEASLWVLGCFAPHQRGAVSCTAVGLGNYTTATVTRSLTAHNATTVIASDMFDLPVILGGANARSQAASITPAFIEIPTFWAFAVGIGALRCTTISTCADLRPFEDTVDFLALQDLGAAAFALAFLRRTAKVNVDRELLFLGLMGRGYLFLQLCFLQ